MWTVHVDVAGIVGDPIPSAAPGRYGFRPRFAPGDFSFVANVDDPVLRSDLPFGDDMVSVRVNLYDDGALRWRGRPLPWDSEFFTQLAVIRCRTDEYMFGRRFFGWAERTNLLENGSFEDWTAGMPDSWGLNGSATVDEVAAITDGASAARLTDTVAAGSYLFQQEPTGFDIGYLPGLRTYVTAWGLVESGSVLKGDLLAELVIVGTGSSPPGPFLVQYTAPQDMTAGQLFRVSLPQFVSAGDWVGEARLYSIDGEVVWDDSAIVFPDATTVAQNGGAGEDVAELFQNVIEYSQTAPWSDLVLGHDAPPTGQFAIPGVNLAGFDHSSHEYVATGIVKILDEYGLDGWVGNDDLAHLRTKRGDRRDDLAIVTTLVTPPADARAVIAGRGDPSLGTNVAVVSGMGDLFSADEAGDANLAAFGGVTLARWERAPINSTPQSLSRRAAQIVGTEAVAPAFLTLRIPLDDGVVGIGDVVPVTVDHGWVQIPETDYRVVSVDVDPHTRMQTCAADVDDGVPLDSEGS